MIKKVIEYCNYYVVIIGDHYGRLATDDVSYTEKEYRYALLDLTIFILIHISKTISGILNPSFSHTFLV